MTKRRKPPSGRTEASRVPSRAARPPGSPRRSAADLRGGQARAARQRRNRWIAGTAVAAVIVIVGALVGVKLAGGGSSSSSNASNGSTPTTSPGAAPPRQPAPPAAVARVTSVPIPTLVAGAAKVTNLNAAQPTTGAPLTSGGKPEVLYIGAEFCPICATQRWPMVVALSHFGTFSNLSETHSAVQEGNIATFSFYGSTYASPYLTFTPVETTTNQPSGNYYVPLETPTAAQMAVWRSKQGNNLTFPFIDMGGKLLLETSQFSPDILIGQSFDQIVAAVGDNNTTVGAQINASAAVLIKNLCSITDEKPAATCRAVANVSPSGGTTGGPSSPAEG